LNNWNGLASTVRMYRFRDKVFTFVVIYMHDVHES
jgi:hypothetical protein